MPSRVNFQKTGKILKSFLTKKQRIGPEEHSGSVFCKKRYFRHLYCILIFLPSMSTCLSTGVGFWPGFSTCRTIPKFGIQSHLSLIFSKFASAQGPFAVELWRINMLVLSRPCSCSARFSNFHTGIHMKSDAFEGPWSVKMADVLQVSGTWRTVGRIGVASSQGSRCPF